MKAQDPKADSSVTIERLHGIYLVPRQHPAGEELRWRLDAVMRNRLATVCGQALSQVLEADGPSIWLIRRLDVDLALDVGAVDDESVARTWSHRLATSIARTIASGADCDRVLHFADWAAYLVQFVADLAEDRAWGKWYYGPFDSLRSLPISAAVREALVRESEHAETVLLRLAAQRRLEEVLSVLSESDAQRIYETCFAARAGSAAGLGQSELMQALLSVWPIASPRASPRGMATAHNALRLYVALRMRSPGLSIKGGLRVAIDHLLGFAEILRRVPAPDALIAHLVAGDLRGAIELARGSGLTAHLESLPFFQQMAAGDGDSVARVARTVGPTTAAHEGAADETRATARTLATPFGGIFLLLPSLLDLGLPELIEAAPYPDPQGMSKAQALRSLLALKCLGRPRAIEAVADPALQLAVGLDKPPSSGTFQRLSESATLTMDQACLRLLVEGLARRGRAEGRCLSAELTTAAPSGEEVLLLRDVAYDAWVYAADLSGDAAETQAALDQGLTLVQEAVEAPVECLLLGPSLGRRLDMDVLAGWAGRLVWVDPDQVPGVAPLRLGQSSEGHSLTVHTAEPGALPEEVRGALLWYLTRVRPAAQELAYLSLTDLTPPVAANLHFDLTWSLFAHAVLKAFASRLMGFDWSSAEYLYRNFLTGTSTLRAEVKEILVQLPRSSLHVVLRMAGVDGQTYSVPWLNDAEVTLSLTVG